MRIRLLLSGPVLAVAAAFLLGCGGGDDDAAASRAGGTLVITTAADVDFLLPPIVDGVQGKQLIDQLFDHLAEIGDALNTVGDAGFRPMLAERWEWAPDSLSIVFHLNPRARWHDGRPVRAADVRFTHELYRDPRVASPAASLIANIDSITARDSVTAVAWFAKRQPEQFFSVAHQLFILPEHLLRNVDRAQIRAASFARDPIGSGRFRFVRWVPGQVLEIAADTGNYRGRPSLDRVIWTIAPDPVAASTRLLRGEADMLEVLRPETIQEVQRQESLKLVPYPSLTYGFMLLNLRDPANPARPHPVFGDRETRRALTMAVDRQRAVQNVFDSLAYVAKGPFSRAISTADTTLSQVPFDLEGAKRLLDSLGWRDANGDGVRERNGRPLEFAIATPSSSRPRVNFSLVLQEQLRQAGARVTIDEMEFNAFLERQRSQRFDAAMVALYADPSPSGIRQHWTTKRPGQEAGSNAGSYSNPTVDALVDSALTSSDAARTKALFKRIYQTIVDDAPAIWLYENRMVAGMHDRIRPTGMRADGWWAHLADWSIPPGERIARDRMPPRAGSRDSAGAAAPDSAGVAATR